MHLACRSHSWGTRPGARFQRGARWLQLTRIAYPFEHPVTPAWHKQLPCPHTGIALTKPLIAERPRRQVHGLAAPWTTFRRATTAISLAKRFLNRPCRFAAGCFRWTTCAYPPRDWALVAKFARKDGHDRDNQRSLATGAPIMIRECSRASRHGLSVVIPCTGRSLTPRRGIQHLIVLRSGDPERVASRAGVD